MSRVATETIRVRAFTRDPGPRQKIRGPGSGEEFRQEWVVPALARAERIAIDLNDTSGYGSSFIDEVFGGLIRKRILTPSEVRRRITVISSDQSYIREAWQSVDEAEARLANNR